MRRHVSPQRRHLRGPAALGLAGAILVAIALVPATAMADGPPVIDSVGAGIGGEVTISAKINPEGLETAYEIGLECSPCGAGDQSIEGTLPAVYESREVVLTLTGLQGGRRYWFAVRAVNLDGGTSRRSEILEIPSSPGPFPDGTGGVGVVEAPYLNAANEQLKKIAEQEAQRRTKEREEQKAKEAAERPVTELVPTEERLHPAAQPEPPACLVPDLRGDTLSAAGRALRSAHCRPGALRRPTRHHGTLRVSAQSVPAGKRLSPEARVALTLVAKSGAKEKRH